MPVDEFAFDLHQHRGIVLLTLARVSGEIDPAPIFAEDARHTVMDAVDNDPDFRAVVRPDLYADDHVPLDFNVVPGAEKVARLAIIRIARLRLGRRRAQ